MAAGIALAFNQEQNTIGMLMGNSVVSWFNPISCPAMIDLKQVGANPQQGADGTWSVGFGLYLPEISPDKGYHLMLRVIHQQDQFIRGIEPRQFLMNWQAGAAPGLWAASIPLLGDPSSHFGQEGKYLYRYQLLRENEAVTFWFKDPFGRDSGLGTLSAFTVDPHAQAFAWTDAAYQVPEVNDMVVYELNVREFNLDFRGVIAQLDYLWDLGVNVLELMPVTNVKEDVEWGYTPLSFFSPDERLGGPAGMKQLVNACHQKGMAVIVDAVYAHAHPEFAYNQVYDTSGEANPMMGYFGEEFFDRPGMDYHKAFTREYFLALNQFWLEEYHVDGFRYDYVPGMYDGPAGKGYADLVHQTYLYSKKFPRFQTAAGRSKIIQCAEHLPDPKGILSQTYTNCCWQNGLLDQSRNMAKWNYVSERLAHLLDPEFLGFAAEFKDEAAGESFPVAPFQYLESHDHRRFINEIGQLKTRDLVGEPYGDRSLYYRMQPYVMALYTAKGIPMLWQGQEFGENYGVPPWGIGRNLFERPLHWEYFYDEPGKALVRIHRIMGSLRRSHRALGSRGFFFYYHNGDHLQKGVIAYRREAEATGDQGPESLLVVLNFSGQQAEVWIPFPAAGNWVEQIDQTHQTVVATQNDQWLPVVVPSNYGAVYLHQ